MKLCHHKHGTETFIKKNAFLIKRFFLSLITFKIILGYFWLLSLHCAGFFLLLQQSGCEFSTETSAGVWLETGIWMLLLVGPENSMSVFYFLFFCCTWAFSSCSKQKGLSGYLCAGFSLLGLLLLQSTGFGAQAQYLRCTGLVAARHMASSHTRDQTWVLCIGR